LDEYTASVIGIALLTITCLGVMQVMFWRESNYHIFDAIRRLIRDEGFE
jgi:hypothetical protein